MATKKIVIFIMYLVGIVLLFSCRSDNNNTSETDPPHPSAAESDARETDSIVDRSGESEASSINAPQELRIAFVTSPNVAEDGAFNENNYNGVLTFIKSNPDSTVSLVHDLDIARALEAVSGAVADYDVIVTPGFQFSRITQIAIDNPDKKFILMDTYPTDDESNVVTVDNIVAIQFREQDGGFLAGIAAAMETRTNKVASIGGMSTNPANLNYQFGFEAGVHYANKHLGTEVELVSIPSYAGTDTDGNNVGGSYVGSFNDDSLCRLLADNLFDEGVDIIFSFAGNASSGAFLAAMERENVFIIGAGTDQVTIGLGDDGRNVDLTSIVKAMGLNVTRTLESVLDGTFNGGNYRLGIDTDSIVYIDTPDRHQLSPGTISQLEILKALMKSDTIIPPSTYGGTPEDFPGL